VAEAAHAAAVHGLPREQRAVGVEAPHAAVRVADHYAVVQREHAPRGRARRGEVRRARLKLERSARVEPDA